VVKTGWGSRGKFPKPIRCRREGSELKIDGIIVSKISQTDPVETGEKLDRNEKDRELVAVFGGEGVKKNRGQKNLLRVTSLRGGYLDVSVKVSKK